MKEEVEILPKAVTIFVPSIPESKNMSFIQKALYFMLGHAIIFKKHQYAQKFRICEINQKT